MLWACILITSSDITAILTNSGTYRLWLVSTFHSFLLNLWWLLESRIEIFEYTFFSYTDSTVSELEQLLANNGGLPIELKTMVQDVVINFSGFNTIVKVVTAITVVSVFIKYGYIIFSDFFLQIKDANVGSITSLFKRTIIAMIICLVSPTLLINGFLFFTALGMASYSNIDASTLSNADVIKISFLRDAEKYGISPLTYCDNKVAQINFGSNSSKSLEHFAFPSVLRENSSYDVERELYDTWCGDKLSNEKLDNSSLSYMGKWSGEYPARVGQTLIDKVSQSGGDFFFSIGYKSYNEPLDDIEVVPFMAVITNDDNTQIATPSSVLSYFGRPSKLVKLLCRLVTGLYTFSFIFRTAKNFIELISLILMMWMYIQGYVSDSKGNVFNLYCQKIATVLLTQFYIVSLFYLASAEIKKMSETPNMITLVMAIALIIATLKGTSLVSDMVNPSALGSR